MDDTFLAARNATRRLSDAERDDAIAALRHERAAGRLDDVELGERIRTARAARTRGELGPCFADLPESAPDGTTADPVGAARRAGGPFWVVVALSPFVAVALFFITGFALGGWMWAWLWFLLIPVAGIVSAALRDRSPR